MALHTPKDFAVFFDTSEEGQRLLEAAAHFAGGRNARLIGIWAVDGQTGEPVGGGAGAKAIEQADSGHEAAMAARLLRIGKSLGDAATRYGLNPEFRVIPSHEAGSTAALRALHCDLLIVGYPHAPGLPFAWTYADLLEQSGEPLLIVPRLWKGGELARRITVVWNAHRPTRRALADALPLLIAAQSVDLLIVDSEGSAEWDCERAAMDMAVNLARHGVQIDVQRIALQSTSVADTVIMHARDRGADMIVFVDCSRSRISDAMSRGITHSLLAEVPLPLFVPG